jgi:hypothetical protein
MRARTHTPAQRRAQRAAHVPVPLPVAYTVPTTYTAHQLTTILRLAKTQPLATFTPRLFGASPMSSVQYLAWFRRRLHEKINSHLPTCQTTGRKHTLEYQARMHRDGCYINMRARASGRNILSNPELKARYPEIDNREIGC